MQEPTEHADVPGLHSTSRANGLVSLQVKTPSVSGELFLHGAHVTAWQPSGHRPVLWLSKSSYFELGKPIRGGVPICFPWFGLNPNIPSAPAHGSARTTLWSLADARTSENGQILITLVTQIELFSLRFEVSMGNELRLTLQTTLARDAMKSHSFEDALHTYFAVGDVRSISIHGLENVGFIDKMDGARHKPATTAPIEFSGETDRVYNDTEDNCVLTDKLWKRSILVRKSGSRSTVIWNPWIEKSIRMPDFGEKEWSEMVCIETANVGTNRVSLEPGQSHATTVSISVQDMTA